MPRKVSLFARRAKAASKKLSTVGSFLPNGLKETALETVLPAFGAYAASRFLERIVFVQVMKRWPKLGKHAPVVAGLVAVVAAHYAGQKIEKLKKYDQAMLIGSAISLIQILIQTYLPGFAWIVSDFSADQYKSQLGPRTTADVTAKQITPSPSWSQALVPANQDTPVYQGSFTEDEGMDITPSIADIPVEMLDDNELDYGSLGNGDGLN